MDLSVSDLLSLGSPSRPASPWSEGAVAPGPFPQPRGPPVSVSWPFRSAFVDRAALSEAFGAKPSGGVLGVRCLASLSPRALRALCSAPLSEAGCPGALFRGARGARGVGFQSRDQHRTAFIQGRTEPISLTTHPVGPRPPAGLSPRRRAQAALDCQSGWPVPPDAGQAALPLSLGSRPARRQLTVPLTKPTRDQLLQFATHRPRCWGGGDDSSHVLSLRAGSVADDTDWHRKCGVAVCREGGSKRGGRAGPAAGKPGEGLGLPLSLAGGLGVPGGRARAPRLPGSSCGMSPHPASRPEPQLPHLPGVRKTISTGQSTCRGWMRRCGHGGGPGARRPRASG